MAYQPLAEGTWPCTVISATCGEDRGLIVVQINVKIDDGPSKGRTCTYEDTIDARSSIYIARSCKAVGWKGAKITDTLSSDVAAWVAATGGKSTIDIKHIEIKKGKRYDKWVDDHDRWVADGKQGEEPKPPIWDKPSAVGRGPRPLATPSANAAADADEAMRKALGDDGSAPPMGDAPPAGDVEDIPFATSAWMRVNGGVL